MWRFFKVDENDRSKAECNICKAKLSRGGLNTSTYNTSNLIKHLKTHHDTEYKASFASSGVNQLWNKLLLGGRRCQGIIHEQSK